MTFLFRTHRIAPLFGVLLVASINAQDPIGTLEGRVSDPSSAIVSGAGITAKNIQTGLTRTVQSSRDGSFQVANLPVGDYSISVSATGFAAFTTPVRIDIGQIANLPITLQVAGGHAEVNVAAQDVLVDTSQTIGKVVLSDEATDLPLNGRDLTQLGLLQPGVAPMTAGLAEAGGISRAGQAFAVNGQRPESNNYLLDGVSNVDSVNGGYALRVPVDAVSEFRILTLNAPAEYGNTSGATTSVVTKSGGNLFHGDAYDFFRNSAMDTRNFFATDRKSVV